MQFLIGSALFVAMCAAIVGWFLPRFSAYLLGPLFLMIGISALVISIKTSSSSDHSFTGAFVQGLLSLASIFGNIGGVVLVVFGYKSVSLSNAAAEQSEETKLVARFE